jgi:hypothetical protein
MRMWWHGMVTVLGTAGVSGAEREDEGARVMSISSRITVS